MAQRLAKLTLLRGREQMTMTAEFGGKHLSLKSETLYAFQRRILLLVQFSIVMALAVRIAAQVKNLKLSLEALS